MKRVPVSVISSAPTGRTLMPAPPPLPPRSDSASSLPLQRSSPDLDGDSDSASSSDGQETYARLLALKREYDAALGRAGKVFNIVKAMSPNPGPPMPRAMSRQAV